MLAVFNGIALNLSGSTPIIAPTASIEVRTEVGGTIAAIFSDEAGTAPITNPSAFADSQARFQFYAAGLARGYSVKVTDGASTYTLHNVAVGTFGQVDNPITTKGDILVGGSGGVPTRKAVGADAYSLLAEAGADENVLWLPPGARAERIINGEIVESHAGNAVTYTLKGRSGVDLSATNPCYLLFPSATLISGDFDIVKLTANISVTVSSGSTLGHASAVAQHTFVYALKTGSTAELFVSTLPPDYPGTFLGQRLVTTTAEGGAGAADSAAGIYSTTARSNVSWIPVAKVKGTQTVAGTWAASPTQVDMAPFTIPSCAFRAVRSGGAAQTAIATGTVTKVQLNAEGYDFDSVYDAVTNFRYQPNIAGLYSVKAGALWLLLADAAVFELFIHRNGSVERAVQHSASRANDDCGLSWSAYISMNGTTDYLELFVSQSSGGNRDLYGGVNYTYLEGLKA